jgi:nitroreductase
MDAMNALTTRRSVRKYKPDPVSRELLEQIVDAGRLAPTARNVQPWEFVVVTDPERRRRLADLSEFGKFIADAPACIIVLSRPTKYFLEDGSAATTNMLNAAAALGLGNCWVAGDKKSYAADIVALCGAPPDLQLISLIAIGYAVEIPSPSKRPLAEVLHWEHF